MKGQRFSHAEGLPPSPREIGIAAAQDYLERNPPPPRRPRLFRAMLIGVICGTAGALGALSGLGLL